MWSETAPRGLMFHQLIRRRFFNPRYNKINLHSSRDKYQRARNSPRGDGTFRFFFTWRKRSTSSGRNGFELPLRTPANLIPCPYVPRIANEPSTWPITVHCGTSKTPSNNHLHIPSVLRYTSFPCTFVVPLPSAFLTKPFRIIESLPEVRIVPLNSRPCIFRCRIVKKKKHKRTTCVFPFFFTAEPTFLLGNFCISQISPNITDISWNLKYKMYRIYIFITSKTVTVLQNNSINIFNAHCFLNKSTKFLCHMHTYISYFRHFICDILPRYFLLIL